MRVTKVASTPSNPAIGLARGVAAILSEIGAAPAAVAGLISRLVSLKERMKQTRRHPEGEPTEGRERLEGWK
jgi:hypothetical protein